MFENYMLAAKHAAPAIDGRNRTFSSTDIEIDSAKCLRRDSQHAIDALQGWLHACRCPVVLST